MPTITTERLIDLLSTYVREQGASVDLLLIGALALQAYGWHDRPTHDVDGEIAGAHGTSPSPLAQAFLHRLEEGA